ncbi:MAG: hypothetical protein AB7P52_09645 [Alphaproteobacteria bacterium]
MSTALSRRRFLLGTVFASLGGGLALSAAGKAHALSSEPLPHNLRSLYLAGCQRAGEHEALIDQVLAQLRDDGVNVDDPAIRQAALDTTYCSICGCPLSQHARKSPPVSSGT